SPAQLSTDNSYSIKEVSELLATLSVSKVALVKPNSSQGMGSSSGIISGSSSGETSVSSREIGSSMISGSSGGGGAASALPLAMSLMIPSASPEEPLAGAVF